jgi:RNA polymerase sigma factor (sigma-70 family)
MVNPKSMLEQQIKSIFKRPGRSWSIEEQGIVIEWILDPSRHNKLLAAVVHQVKDRGITETDVEEAWGDFAVRQIYSILLNYDPTRERSVDFWNYLKSCFRKSCLRSAARFNRLGWKTISLNDEEDEKSRAMQEMERTETKLFLLSTPTGRSPFKDMENGSRVVECIKSLPPHYYNVLVLRYVEGYTITEIAELLHKTEGYVKPTLARARKRFIELYEGRR